MYQLGRVCYKIAGRDSNNVCVIISPVKDGRVLVDGNVRRKVVNIMHLEPTSKTVNVAANAVTETVLKALEAAGYVAVPKGKARKTAPRTMKVKVVKKAAPSAAKADAKASAPKAEKPVKAAKAAKKE